MSFRESLRAPGWNGAKTLVAILASPVILLVLLFVVLLIVDISTGEFQSIVEEQRLERETERAQREAAERKRAAEREQEREAAEQAEREQEREAAKYPITYQDNTCGGVYAYGPNEHAVLLRMCSLLGNEGMDGYITGLQGRESLLYVKVSRALAEEIRRDSLNARSISKSFGDIYRKGMGLTVVSVIYLWNDIELATGMTSASSHTFKIK